MQDTQPWLDSQNAVVKLHFLPAYAPHLNSNPQRLWRPCTIWVNSNQTMQRSTIHRGTFDFLPHNPAAKWPEFRAPVTDKLPASYRSKEWQSDLRVNPQGNSALK